MLWEVVANSVDQHLAGRCSRVDVVIHADGSVEVGDDGPGLLAALHGRRRGLRLDDARCEQAVRAFAARSG